MLRKIATILAVLMAAEEAGQGPARAPGQEELRTIHLQALSRLEAPRPGFVARIDVRRLRKLAGRRRAAVSERTVEPEPVAQIDAEEIEGRDRGLEEPLNKLIASSDRRAGRHSVAPSLRRRALSTSRMLTSVRWVARTVGRHCVFPDAAAARERRLLGQPSTELSTDLTSPEHTEADPGALSEAETHAADAV